VEAFFNMVQVMAFFGIFCSGMRIVGSH